MTQRQLDGQVVFTGRVPHEQVGAWYALCDLMVYPRKPLPLCEAISPIKPLEPMALGIPVLCSDVGALREMIVEGVNGHCFPKGDRKALTESLLAIMDGHLDTATVRAQSRDWVAQHRDWRQLTRPLAEMYRRLYLNAGGRQIRREHRARIAAGAKKGRADELAAWRAGLDQALPAGVKLLDLTEVPAAAEITAGVGAFRQMYPGRKLGADLETDVARLSWVLAQLPGGRRLLEVGPTHGLLLEAAGRKGLYRERMAIASDPDTPLLDTSGGIERRVMPATALDFPDRHFDAVCCLGSLARLPEAALGGALAEMRRVCAGMLVVMVPLRERLPIGKHHRIRFTEQRVLELLPDAEIALLVRRDITKPHWAACIERVS